MLFKMLKLIFLIKLIDEDLFFQLLYGICYILEAKKKRKKKDTCDVDEYYKSIEIINRIKI